MRGAGRDARGSAPVCSASEARAASRSWIANISSSVPSNFSEKTVSPVAPSPSFAVTRSRGPTRWNPPDSTQRQPRARPSPASSAPPARAWRTRSRGTSVTPGSRARSVARLSAKPLPIHSSSGFRERLTKSTMASVSGRATDSSPEASARRSERKAAALGYRFSGSRARARARRTEVSAETPSPRIGDTSDNRIAAMRSAADAPGNAGLPESISYRTAPREKRSDRSSRAWPFNCSGDM